MVSEGAEMSYQEEIDAVLILVVVEDGLRANGNIHQYLIFLQ